MNIYSIYFHGEYFIGEHIVEAASPEDAVCKFLLEWGEDVKIIEVRDRSTNKRKILYEVL